MWGNEDVIEQEKCVLTSYDEYTQVTAHSVVLGSHFWRLSDRRHHAERFWRLDVTKWRLYLPAHNAENATITLEQWGNINTPGQPAGRFRTTLLKPAKIKVFHTYFPVTNILKIQRASLGVLGFVANNFVTMFREYCRNYRQSWCLFTANRMGGRDGEFPF
jgi:hypothetical protein